MYCQCLNRNSRGFTLVELVIVIIMLAILGVAVTNYIGFGTLLYRDVAEREEILASARFSIERLNREVRASLPNSQQTSNDGNCLRFVPVLDSSTYVDFPISPNVASDNGSLIAFNQYQFSPNQGQQISVYNLNASDIYSFTPTSLVGVKSYTPPSSGNIASLEFTSTIRFPLASPSQRVFVVARPVQYCVSNGQLTRTVSSWPTETGVPNISSLMAENITVLNATDPNFQPVFEVIEADLSRNGMVKIFLNFSRDGGAESLVFHHGIHIQNVP
ncbi:PilW family protein [Motilimonas pumila]|uniref:Type II secretion system protein n=1 Tax=Motilimonas pumila TaxID=2303987 RepID=A0A418YHY8_9GAMM|nr:type II secretion system protein [Motilimonas pumila]RJG49982.1 type II secretion system protein [Motilimonas pumila]